MADVQFTNNSVNVKMALNEASIAYLYEAGGEIEAQVKRNTRVGKTGQTKNAWTYVVDETKGVCTVGNPLENAIWEEFGTGEYAVNGDGRKGGWYYKGDDGEFHHTFGKTPNRALQSAFETLKGALVARAEQVVKGGMT